MASTGSRRLPVLAAVISLSSIASSQASSTARLELEPSLPYSTGSLPGEKLERLIYWDRDTASAAELGGREVRLGALPIDRERVVRLAWDRRGGGLFVDRDGDGELGDEEPVGVLWSGEDGWLFERVRLHAPEETGPGAWDVTVRIATAKHGNLESFAIVQSGWTGMVELDGKAYRLAVVDDLDGVFTPGVDQLALLPIDDSEAERSLKTVWLPQRVLVGAKLYDLALALEPGGEAGVVVASFALSDAPLVEVEVLGTHIARLQLDPLGETSPRTAVFATDARGTLRLPAGRYLARVVLDGGELGELTATAEVEVREGAADLLRLGAPLENDIEVERRAVAGLELTYRLLGIGGEEYHPEKRSDTPPRFVARVGERVVAAADFRYG